MTTEERIQKEAEEFAHSNWPVVNAIAAYIRGATKEAARNKENAVAMEKEIERLKEEIKGWQAYKENIDQALNSGDGVYRP